MNITEKLVTMEQVAEKFFEKKDGIPFTSFHFRDFMREELRKHGIRYAVSEGRLLLREGDTPNYNITQLNLKTWRAKRKEAKGNGNHNEEQQTLFHQQKEKMFDFFSKSDLIIRWDAMEKCFKVYPVAKRD